MEALTYARVQEHLAKLKPDRIAAALDGVAEAAAQTKLPYIAFLTRALTLGLGPWPGTARTQAP